MPNEALWYKDAVIYELHVRSFYDSVGDGMGDFGGLAQKLAYLQDLGVTAIWLLPFYPSPLRDDGYDIADYQNIHPQYGTLDSFREFLDAAHERGLKVITELVLNHTSDQHPWFQRARRSPPGSIERDFYVWSDTTERYASVPIVFKDFETSNWAYDSVAKAYYWHRFYSHQPDLNFDNPAVRQAILPIVDFWFAMGVDGMRLDAVPYLFEREGTSCAGLPETHEFLRELRAHVDAKFPNRMLLAEANVWPEEAVKYFGNGDECQMAFHFPVMPRLYMAISREDRFPIVDIMQQTPSIPETCQWAMFLRNHDELTLEMVTDEERDSMYRAYARDSQARINVGIRRRLAPLLSNNRRRIELMNGLLFSLPGTPVIYYGDEIGMGDNIFLGDRNSVRTPMQWSADRNAGFSRANSQKLFLPVTIDSEYHYEATNVEAQQNNSQSLLWWMKRLIDIRKRAPAFSRGTLTFLHPMNRKVLSFLRQHDGQTILVVANLSRFVQYCQLDLSAFAGFVPVELFGGTRLPPIGKSPYFITLGPHSFYWFELNETITDRVSAPPVRTLDELPSLSVRKTWTEVATRDDDTWDRVLTKFLEHRSVDRDPSPISGLTVSDWLVLPETTSCSETLLLLIDVQRVAGEPQRIVLPLAFATEQLMRVIFESHPEVVLARVSGTQSGLLYDTLAISNFSSRIMNLVATTRVLRSRRGHILATWLSQPLTDVEQSAITNPPKLIEVEHHNVSAAFDDRLILKVLTHVADGPHPEVEVGQFLASCGHPCSIAKLRGAVELQGRRQPSLTLAMLHEYVVNEGDAWEVAVEMLSAYSERVLAGDTPTPPPNIDWRTYLSGTVSPQASDVTKDELLEESLELLRLLGHRTAELHCALASDLGDPHFAPEPFTVGYRRSIYQSMRGAALDVSDTLLQLLEGLTPDVRAAADAFLGQRVNVLRILRRVLDEPLNAMRIRCHGDYHLGQVLITGHDCVIIDFEGKPHIPMSERRLKRSPLRDVASMFQSIDYVSRVVLCCNPLSASSRDRMQGRIRSDDLPKLTPWIKHWRNRGTLEFLQSYLAYPGIKRLLPATTRGIRVLLDAFFLERAVNQVSEGLRIQSGHPELTLHGMLEHVNAAILDEPQS